MSSNKVVCKSDAHAARSAFLADEKAFTTARDAMAARRRELPWVLVEKDYVFAGPTGRTTFAELFSGRNQLIVQHFMFAPGWEEGCVGCSLIADHVGAALPHIQARDASFVAISRAPIAEIERFKQRMGWPFQWVSSSGSDFNYDFDVSFRLEDIGGGRALYNYRPLDFEIEDLSGFSVFIRNDAGQIFHTYSTFARGDEMLCTAYMFIDLLPRGRNEEALDPPMSWWRHHDKYGEDANGDCCCEGN